MQKRTRSIETEKIPEKQNVHKKQKSDDDDASSVLLSVSESLLLVSLDISTGVVRSLPVPSKTKPPFGVWKRRFDPILAVYPTMDLPSVTAFMRSSMSNELFRDSVKSEDSSRPLLLAYLFLSFRWCIDRPLLVRHFPSKRKFQSSCRVWFQLLVCEAMTSSSIPSEAKNIPIEVFDEVRDFYLVLREFNEEFFSDSALNQTNRILTKAFSNFLGFKVSLPFRPVNGLATVTDESITEKSSVSNLLGVYNHKYGRSIDPILYARSDALQRRMNDSFRARVYQPLLTKITVPAVEEVLQVQTRRLEAATGLRLHDIAIGVVLLPPLSDHEEIKFESGNLFYSIGSSKKGESDDQKADLHALRLKVLKLNREGTLTSASVKTDVQDLIRKYPNIHITENRPFYFYPDLKRLLSALDEITHPHPMTDTEYKKLYGSHTRGFASSGLVTHDLRKFYACRVYWDKLNYKRFHPIVLINFLLSHDKSISISTSSAYFKYFVSGV